MDRRQALRNIGMGAGLLVATPTVLSILQSCTSEPEFIPVFLTKGEGHALRRTVDLIIPSDDAVPGAVDVGVHSFIDQFWNEVLEEEDQAFVRKGFALFADSFRGQYEKELEAGKPEEFEAMLSEYLPRTKEAERAIGEKMGEFYQAFEEDPSAEPDPNAAIASLLMAIRGMTSWGWKESEEIGKNVLWYDPVPGVYNGCVPLNEAGNGNAMAL